MRTHELSPVHPGEILREEFLTPMGITPHALAIALRVPATRINAIVNGARAVTADTALRLGRYFGTSGEFWMNLQRDYELRMAARLARRDIESVQPRTAA